MPLLSLRARQVMELGSASQSVFFLTHPASRDRSSLIGTLAWWLFLVAMSLSNAAAVACLVRYVARGGCDVGGGGGGEDGIGGVGAPNDDSSDACAGPAVVAAAPRAAMCLVTAYMCAERQRHCMAQLGLVGGSGGAAKDSRAAAKAPKRPKAPKAD